MGDGNHNYLPTRSKRHSKARRLWTARFAVSLFVNLGTTAHEKRHSVRLPDELEP